MAGRIGKGSMSTVWTHEGYEVGADSRTTANYRRKVILRETKTLWISADGRKYSKKHEGLVPGQWPMYQLDLATVVAIAS